MRNLKLYSIVWGLLSVLVAVIVFGVFPRFAVNASASADNAVVVLAVDTSASMYGGPMQNAQEANIQFLEELAPGIPVALVSFGERAALIQPATTDRELLAERINSLQSIGRTALYDGVSTAVEVAAGQEQPVKVVVLLGDGYEYGGLSSATREEALTLAQDSDVVVNTVGLGPGADNDFFTELADITSGEMFPAPNAWELADVYETVTASVDSQIEALSAELGSEFANGGQVEALDDILPAHARLFNGDQLIPMGENSNVGFVPAQEDGLVDLGLLEGIASPDETVAMLPNVSTMTDPAASGPETLPATIREPSLPPLGGGNVEPRSNFVPISIQPETPEAIEIAELRLNDVTLTTFSELPYEFDLNKEQLEVGLYELTFTAVYAAGNTAMDSVEFRVVEVVLADGTTTLEVQADTARDQIVADFNSNDGLTLASAEVLEAANVTVAAESRRSVLEILSQPVLDIVPPEWVELIFTPRPVTFSIIVIIMTVSMIPQAVFTLVWMLYTWNNPQAAEEYASPTTYEEPTLKFSALVPARKEEAVIYETIMKVDAIKYPDELKEILILVRDDGKDDATLAEARRAMADLGHKGNIKLITFNDGPFNKPNGLNRGFNQGTGDVFGIFDAEDQPHPEIYNIVNTTMLRKGADVVQSGVQLMTYFSRHRKEPWFAALNVLEYFFWFKSGLHCFTREFSVTPLGGNTVFGKREWLDTIAMPHHRTAEGHNIPEVWDERCLTEDADLGIRLTNAGASIQIVYSAEHATQEETPDSIEQFVKQRTRWNQGFYEIFRKGDWMNMPMLKQRVVALYILLNSIMQAMLILYLPFGIFVALTQEIPVPLAIISWIPIYLLIMQMVTQLIGIAEYARSYNIPLPLGYRAKMILYYYPYQIMLGVSAARAVGRFVTGKSNWEKTAHSGAHRPSAPVVSS